MKKNAPTRANTPVKRLCAIPQKCPIPNLRIAALMNSRLCFEHQIHFSLLLQKTSLSPRSSPSGKRGARKQAGLVWQGSEIPACWGQGLPAPARQRPQTKAGWRLSRDNSTARNPTSDAPCSREARPRNRQQGVFYSCGAQPSASGAAAARTCGCPLGHLCMPGSSGV